MRVKVRTRVKVKGRIGGTPRERRIRLEDSCVSEYSYTHSHVKRLFIYFFLLNFT